MTELHPSAAHGHAHRSDLLPPVPMDALRLRDTVTAAHTQEELDYVLKVLTRVGRELGVLPANGPA